MCAGAGVVLAIAAMLGGATVQAQPILSRSWCAFLGPGGEPRCVFATFEECRRAVARHGRRGPCFQKPFYGMIGPGSKAGAAVLPGRAPAVRER